MLKNALSVYKIILKYSPRTLCLKGMTLIFSVLLVPLNIVLMQELIDSVYGISEKSMDSKGVLFYGAALSLTMFALASLPYLEKWIDLRAQHRLVQSFTPHMLMKFTAIDYGHFDNPEMLDTIQQMGDKVHEKMIVFFNATLKTLSNILSIILTSLLFAKLSPYFLIGFFMICLPMLYFDFKSTRMIQELFDAQSAEQRKQNYLMSLITSKHTLCELKLFRGIDYVIDKWKLSAELMFKAEVKTTLKSKCLLLLSSLLLSLFTVYVMYFLSKGLYQKEISLGLFIALVGAIESIYVMTYSLSGSLAEWVKAGHTMGHYLKFMKMEEDNRPQKNQSSMALDKVLIEFKEVHFTYPNAKEKALNGVSFVFQSHESLAIVGRNGAGKSTLIKLLCGLYKVDQGVILVNGINIDDLSRQELKKVCSLVFQDYSKFNLSLRENIALTQLEDLEKTEKIQRAMAQGLVDEAFKGDLDQLLGNLEKESRDLSEGQWQRIAIARACFSESAFIVLDEPTASIDPMAESKMYHSFFEVLGLKGCIIISHRLASAKICQKILVLDQGKSIAYGSHDELMKTSKPYAKMFNEQSWWYLEKEDDLRYENL